MNNPPFFQCHNTGTSFNNRRKSILIRTNTTLFHTSKKSETRGKRRVGRVPFNEGVPKINIGLKNTVKNSSSIGDFVGIE
ncbi:hypothetical protein HanRHA438_Chr07g0310131 [Helianthus annuus]|nr:hypothetical protein HanRHA438_Chr07g0310131 [Helianthus annuus]